MKTIATESLPQKWLDLLSESDSQKQVLITGLRQQIESVLGIEAGIFFLDFFTTQRGESPTTDEVTAYVNQMKPAKEVDSARIAEAIATLSGVQNENRCKICCALKYSLTDRLLHDIPLTVMNYGYADAAEPDLADEQLEASERPLRYGLQLYRALVQDAILRERDVLEVGSGNGGGANWMVRQYQPRSYVGVDQCFDHIAFCEREFGNDRLAFRYGDAEKLPIETESVDVVLNVESAHCYPSMPDFLSEVHRTLRPGGSFHIADIFRQGGFGDFVSIAESVGMHVTSSREITAKVENGLQKYLPSLVALGKKLDAALCPLYERLVTTRTFNAQNSNWRGQNLEYWNVTLQKK